MVEKNQHLMHYAEGHKDKALDEHIYLKSDGQTTQVIFFTLFHIALLVIVNVQVQIDKENGGCKINQSACQCQEKRRPERTHTVGVHLDLENN